MQASPSKGGVPPTKMEAEKRPSNTKAIQEQSEARKQSVKKPKPRHPLEMLLGDVLVNAAGDLVNPGQLAVPGSVIGLYFAAHWCPPCRSFCPILMLLYDELRKRRQPFEVIFVSLDTIEDSFKEYLSRMPWYAVPFSEEDKREDIAVTFGIKGIPVLVLLDPNTLEIIAHNGREIISRDPRGAYYPWTDLPEEFTRTPPTARSRASSKAASSKSGSSRYGERGRSRTSTQDPRHSIQSNKSQRTSSVKSMGSERD